MEATSLRSSLVFDSLFSSKSPKRNFVTLRRAGAIASAAGRDSCHWNYRGQLVDESMIVLRKRIHEMKVMERNYEPPAEWMEWEKQYYTCYDEFICKFVGFLQTQLMNSRPSFALGMLAVVAMSVPASTFMVILRLLEVANGVLSAINSSC